VKCYIATSGSASGRVAALQETRRVSKEGAAVEVYVPYPLREFTKGAGTVELRADDLAGAIDELNRRYPGLGYRILDDQGRLRRFVNVFVNDEPVSHRVLSEVPLHPGDEVTILPSVAGG
jgi:molybdopterin synthase sulfur carrier subunit